MRGMTSFKPSNEAVCTAKSIGTSALGLKMFNAGSKLRGLPVDIPNV